MPRVSQPNPFNRSFSFSNFQAQNPSLTLPGSQVDLELNNAKATFDGVLTNLAQIQRDDGALKNGSVTFDTLSPSLQTAGIAPALPWVASTAYAMSVSVTHGSAFYRSLVAHTSGVFATDLAAGKWVLIVDFATIALVAASMIAVTPSGSLTTDVQGSLQALDTGKAPLSHTQLSSTISDSTAAGRALLTAADATAQNVLLGTTSLGFQSGDIKPTATLALQSGWYYCDGSNKNRVTDVNLFNAITIQQSGVTTSGSAIITGLSDTTNGGATPMSPGMPVSGIGIPAATVVQSVDSATQVTLSANATGSATTPLVFAPFGVGDGSTTFGLPNGAYAFVGRDNASGSASNIMQVSTTFGITTGTAAAVVASATGLFVGMYVSAPKIPIGTTILAISGTSVTLSANATGTVVTGAIRFSPIRDAQSLGQTGGTLSQTTTLITANLPSITSSAVNSISVNSSVSGIGYNFAPNPANTNSGAIVGPWWSDGVAHVLPGALNSTGNNTISVTSTGTASTPITKQTVQPTIVMNYIIKR
jgi:hypothetical protein